MRNINNNLLKSYRCNETTLVRSLISYLDDLSLLSPEIEAKAYTLAKQIQKQSQNKVKVENLMNMYPLYNKQGRNMMALSEALLRIPDSANQENLLIEKIKNNNWSISVGYGIPLFCSSLFLQFGSKLLPKNRNGFFNRFMVSTARAFTKSVIHKISCQFVLAQSIDKALEKSKDIIKQGYSFSYDMLGESAKTDNDAIKYLKQYEQAIIQTGEFAKTLDNRDDISISIKVSSLHCRYELAKYDSIKEILYDRLLTLCTLASKYDILLFIDAEEAERLVLSLDLVEKILQEESLKNWKKLGLAVQAYQKRGFFVIDEIAKLSKQYSKKIYVRLVKGAYWDGEIKLDQINGVEDFSLFTRKEHTDISYMACVKKMSLYSEEIYPCFATHNAFSIAFVRKIMGNKPYEFQCLQGMGDSIYDNLLKEDKGLRVRKYAPVGKFNHLLPYLVRRLIENGARSSFINQILVKNANTKEIVTNPITLSNKFNNTMHDLIKLPRDLFLSQNRLNSVGKDMAEINIIKDIENKIQHDNNVSISVYSIIDGKGIKSQDVEIITNPANKSEKLGTLYKADVATLEQALDNVARYFAKWNYTPVEERAEILRNSANLLESRADDFIKILVKEAGKTIKDSILEVREAIDFLRYYSARAREEFNKELVLSGPIGERNTLMLEGRGVFLCIAPWNFPLAIFLGQIAAALLAGNTVLAKPAESTTAVGYMAIKLMLEAGLPKEAIAFIPADGSLVGETLLTKLSLGGVAFTGSDATARSINQSLAQRTSSIIPLIAETGGQNAMIVDSTALIEQVTRDVLSSAFQSAGQRCSALRVMFVQEDIADSLITMIKDAMDNLSIGNPNSMNCDVGPIINEMALNRLLEHQEYMKTNGVLIKELKLNPELNGYYFAPRVYGIKSIDLLRQEVFGPVLHIVRFKLDEIESLIQEINSTNFGLTFAIHSRLEKNINLFKKMIRAGNIYINRNQVGAVVGSQPFGGMNNSGTGPKAGGPLYLHKFAVEKTISEDLTASGGDVEIMSKV